MRWLQAFGQEYSTSILFGIWNVLQGEGGDMVAIPRQKYSRYRRWGMKNECVANRFDAFRRENSPVFNLGFVKLLGHRSTNSSNTGREVLSPSRFRWPMWLWYCAIYNIKDCKNIPLFFLFTRGIVQHLCSHVPAKVVHGLRTFRAGLWPLSFLGRRKLAAATADYAMHAPGLPRRGAFWSTHASTRK